MPDSYWAERTYIVRVIFEEFLGIPAHIQKTSHSDVIITAGDHRKLVIADTLFSTPKLLWLEPTSLPMQPLKVWDLSTTNLHPQLVHTDIPIIFGDDPHTLNFLHQSKDQIHIGLDIFGSAFFMLTRYEEVVKTERDSLDRFPASASLAYQENFLMRPIVNEYVEILWTCMLLLWPRLSRRQHYFQTYVSHDVDEPFRYVFSGPKRLFRRCIGDVVRRKSLMAAARSVESWLEVKQGNLIADPCNTFDFIMHISEKQGLQSAFYFIADHTCYPIDGDYDLSHPLMRALLSKIYQRDHEIGLHSSFNTYKDKVQTQKEIDILKSACLEVDICQQDWGGRQHCLRWETPTTWQNLNDVGLTYDTTLCFSEHVGFRCGTCFEYPVFNLLTSECLGLYERPLIVMDATVLEKKLYESGYIKRRSFQDNQINEISLSAVFRQLYSSLA
ncbi:polysaccharide deacetylase family protein [Acaryochloris sp. 'Moss Beach']|uniref:polysaccharide deacetylase family protein n=1 Tax=Acaryochloris sp. 'Moss Beach' TaxID=2740837 RepID=UPI001F1F8E78|nr:polysaccharide deacetylase family protein [Acaryochloris sp. 'Moss Beach']UJB67907.1 polysaccharide deacetylase family protein [Acaryochloris sp. 'Moss Beach']